MHQTVYAWYISTRGEYHALLGLVHSDGLGQYILMAPDSNEIAVADVHVHYLQVLDGIVYCFPLSYAWGCSEAPWCGCWGATHGNTTIL